MSPEKIRKTNFVNKLNWNEFETNNFLWGHLPYNQVFVDMCLESWKRGRYPEIILPRQSQKHPLYRADIIGLDMQEIDDMPIMKLLLLPTRAAVPIVRIKSKPTFSPADPRVIPELP